MKYEELIKDFSWKRVIDTFDWDVDKSFNMAHECCDRWAINEDRIAIYWENQYGNNKVYTYADLRNYSNQLANAFVNLGVKKGDRIAGLLGKEVELIITVLATWKIGAIYVPMFTAFGPEAISYRINDAECKLLVSNQEQANKLVGINTSLEHIIFVDSTNSNSHKLFWEYIQNSPSDFKVECTSITDPAVIQYTSGSTGMPKGAIWSHKIMVSSYPYVKYAMGVEENDILFGGADFGWAYGLMNCTFIPMSFGSSVVIYSGSFSVEKTYQIMEKYKVSNFAYAPTAYRMMMAAGSEVIKKYHLNIKKFSSAGEPLNAEVVRFFKKNFDREIYDHYGCTETGMIIDNFNITDMMIKPGSMGKPSPGFKIALIDEMGNKVPQGQVGQIAVDTKSFPFFFMGYWKNSETTNEKMIENWFCTGDLAMEDDEGYYWFQGRSDDIISCAGYRIGPFEVESSLLEHPAVSEAAVIGKADHTKGEIVKAYVVLNSAFHSTEKLVTELKDFVKKRLSKHQYPREIEFVTELPKTPSGKIQRYMLKQDSIQL